MRHLSRIAIAATAAACLSDSATRAQHHAPADHPQGHAGHQSPSPAADTRIAVAFPQPMATHMLANMRDHLQAVQEITDALARGRGDTAAKIAETRLGMSSLTAHGAHEASKFMPQGMQDAGTAMHRAASRFAIEAQNAAVTGELKPALGMLSDVISACAVCHAGYRLK